MLVNEEVCENVFIISSSTDHEFSAAIHFQGFDVCLLLTDWWRMVFTPDKLN